MAPLCGHTEIEGFLSFLGMVKEIRFEILALLADGHRVFTERVDHFQMHDGKTIDLPVCGAFEIEGGKITAWRDYLDAAPFAGMFS
jgi:limonene-1,2-epoxide hydrolase